MDWKDYLSAIREIRTKRERENDFKNKVFKEAEKNEEILDVEEVLIYFHSTTFFLHFLTSKSFLILFLTNKFQNI